VPFSYTRHRSVGNQGRAVLRRPLARLTTKSPLRTSHPYKIVV